MTVNFTTKENSDLEKQVTDDFIVLGHAVPVEIKDLRKSICAMSYSPTR